MADFQDKTLTCRECGSEFLFTAGEQEFYAMKGFVNEPGRCATCRAARRERPSTAVGNARSLGPTPASRPGRRQMYPAVCSRCGGNAAVPFTPRGDRPVYCSSCYEQIGQQA